MKEKRKTSSPGRTLPAARRWALAGLLAFTALVPAARRLEAASAIQVGYGEGVAGQGGVVVIVTATNDVPIHGYSLALAFPPEVLTLREIGVTGTHVQAFDPAVFPTVDNSLGLALLGVILDFTLEPFTPSELAPGAQPRIIARLTFDVKANAAGGLYPLRLVDGVGNPATFNRFTQAGTSIAPELIDGSFFIAGGYVLSLERKIAFCGATPQVKILALAQHPADLAGFSIAVAYNSQLLNLDLNETGYAATDLNFQLGSRGLIEFFQTDIDSSFGGSRARSRTAAIFDFLEPYGGQVLLASPDSPQSIMRYDFEPRNAAIDCGTVQVLDLTLEDLEQPGSLNNVFLVGDRSITPRLVHGKIYFSTGDLNGRVIEASTGGPVAGVTVVSDPEDYTTTSRVDGSFTLAGMIPGTYALRLSSPGYYQALHAGVTVGGGGAATDGGDFRIFQIPSGTQQRFRRGYINNDGRFDLSDPVALLNYQFRGGTAPVCEQAADSNADERVDLGDAVYLLQFLFRGGPEPPPPFRECGPADPNHPRGFTCQSFPEVACP